MLNQEQAKISLGALNLQLHEARGLGFRVLGLRLWGFGVFGVFGIGAQQSLHFCVTSGPFKFGEAGGGYLGTLNAEVPNLVRFCRV